MSNMNDALSLLKTRRSIRKYKNQPVEKEKIEKCLEAARWAPSASNRQPWEFVIVKEENTRKKLSNIHPYGNFIADSPVVFIPLSNPVLHDKYHLSDTSLRKILTTYTFLFSRHPIRARPLESSFLLA